MEDQPGESGTVCNIVSTSRTHGSNRSAAGGGGSDHAQRLAADAQLVALLARDNFSGLLFEEYQGEMYKYGTSVLIAWLKTGEIFVQCNRRGLHLRRPPRPLQHEDRLDLSDNTLAKALPDFRRRALIERRWTPSGGATLAVYFTNSLPYHFCNPYRSWCREVRKEIIRQSCTESTSDLAYLTAPCSNPEDGFILRESLREESMRLDEQTFHALQLSEWGYRQAEIAEILGTTERAIEGKLRRHRVRQKGHHEEIRLA